MGRENQPGGIAGADPIAATELEQFEQNDEQLTRQRREFIENQKRRIAKGTHDREKAIKLWEHHVARAAKKYNEEFGERKKGYGPFDKSTRQLVAARLARRGEHVAQKLLVRNRSSSKVESDKEIEGFIFDEF